VEAERRQVTVPFADLAGFTASSDWSGEEAAFTLMQDPARLTEDAVREQGGVVQSFAGDGIIAGFDAPVTFGNAPQRACRAALVILEKPKAVGVGAAPVERSIIALRASWVRPTARRRLPIRRRLLQTTCAITPRLVWPCDEEPAERLSRSICRRLRSQRGERSTRAP
jgi:class 3 adenylate cyclase